MVRLSAMSAFDSPRAIMACRLNAVHIRHLQIHQDDIGLALDGQVDRFPTSGRFAHDFGVGRRPEQCLEAIAKELVIVGNQNVDGVLP
jgi:hypothetical protein